MFETFIIISIILAIILLLLRNNTINYIILVLFGVFQLVFIFLISRSYFEHTQFSNFYLILDSKYLEKFIFLDDFSIFFSIITSVLFFVSSISSINKIIFMREKNFSLFSSFMILFLVSLFGVIFAQNLIVLWVFIEATTLTSAILIYQDKTKHSLEAAWKYLFICSIGIAISFVGIVFISLAFNSSSLSFIDLLPLKEIANPFWLELGFCFILIGFGTKAGLAPTHAWLPDAHSEAPSQISALLSGALLNTALLGIIRVLNILPDNVKGICKTYLLLMGLISLFVSSIYMSRSVNYKRLLAYSSIENIGLISIGLSLGGIAEYASYLLMISHSLTKSSLFIVSGVIKDVYHTTITKKVNNLLKFIPFAAFTLILGFLSIAGFPIFLSFFSELKLFYFLISNKKWLLLIIIVFLLLVILFALSKNIFNIIFAKENEYKASELIKVKVKKLNIVNDVQIASAFFLIVLAFLLGFYLPIEFKDFIMKLVSSM
ncbi:MAG: proton-conducting transporter membrane subunit [Spirochaetota bacterium]